jgi:hypothetical protein
MSDPAVPALAEATSRGSEHHKAADNSRRRHRRGHQCRFPNLVDGQDLLRISLLEIYRSIKQHLEPYNTKLRFVEFEIIGGSLQQ